MSRHYLSAIVDSGRDARDVTHPRGHTSRLPLRLLLRWLTKQLMVTYRTLYISLSEYTLNTVFLPVCLVISIHSNTVSKHRLPSKQTCIDFINELITYAMLRKTYCISKCFLDLTCNPLQSLNEEFILHMYSICLHM